MLDFLLTERGIFYKTSPQRERAVNAQAPHTRAAAGLAGKRGEFIAHRMIK